MIKFSTIKGNAASSTTEASSFSSLAKAIMRQNWSPGLYQNNWRDLKNFQSMEVVALDFDGGITIDQILPKLEPYKFILATSRNHQKEKVKKSGKVLPACDRFRVVFQLAAPITLDADYKATFAALKAIFPEADPQCKDASRYFYPCKEMVKIKTKGLKIQPLKYLAPPQNSSPSSLGAPSAAGKGALAKQTTQFIALGAPDGEWNGALFKAAKDLNEQGYLIEEATELLTKPTGHLDRQDEKTIESAFKKEPIYAKRERKKRGAWGRTEPEELETDSLTSLEVFDEAIAHLKNPNATSGLSTGWKEVDKLLGGLRESELGVIQSYPKTGKTTLLTNLMMNLTANGKPAGFASLEMHPAKQVEPDIYSILMKKNIRKEELTDDLINRIRNELISGRGITYYKRTRRPGIEDIVEWCRRIYGEQGIKHIFIDHFHKLVYDEDSRSNINRTITELTSLKYELPELHIMLVVQPTKEGDFERRVGRKTLRGGASIFDELDYLINMHAEYVEKWDEQVGPDHSPWTKKHIEFKKYPRDIRELEFEAIRAKPWSENMRSTIHMKYDAATMLMTPTTYYKPPRASNEESDESYEQRTRGTSKKWHSKKV